MKETTREMIQGFRSRRENFFPKENVAARKFVAEIELFRNKQWGKDFNRGRGSKIWNQRELAIYLHTMDTWLGISAN